MAPGDTGFSRLFDYVLLFQQSDFHHEPQPAYEHVRREIATLLAHQTAVARDQGMPEADVQEARFAVVAWADEMILHQTDWVHHPRWRSTPLQLEYFDTRNGGEELFERLERLRPEQGAVREIFYCCLGLGFQGCYCLGLEDELRLAQIRHAQAQHLAHPVEPVPAMTMLMPQPYQVPPPGGRPLTPPLTQRLLTASMALLAVVPLTCLVAYTAFPDHRVRPQPPALAQVQQALAPYQQGCAAVAVDPVATQPGRVSLTGYLGQEAQRAQLLRVVQRLPGVTQVQDRVQGLPPLLCEVLALLQPWRRAATTSSSGLTMRLDKGDAPLYASEEPLVIVLHTPATFARHVYVDYYGSHGPMQHLLPNPSEPQHVFGPDAAYTVGRLDGPQPWRIAPPFGLELVTVIASTKPLFATPRFGVEPVAAYLDTLRQALAQQAPDDLAVAFQLLTTREQPTP